MDPHRRRPSLLRFVSPPFSEPIHFRLPHRNRGCRCSSSNSNFRSRFADADFALDVDIRGDEISPQSSSAPGSDIDRRSRCPCIYGSPQIPLYSPFSYPTYTGHFPPYAVPSHHNPIRSNASTIATIYNTDQLETKTLSLNGVDYPFRKSFLDESPKFAEKLTKYVTTPSVKEILPKEALVCLCNFVNWDDYAGRRGSGRQDIGWDRKVDACMEVALYLLGKAVECKSLGAVVLERLNSLVVYDDDAERQMIANGRRGRIGMQIISIMQQQIEMKDLVQLVGNVCLSEHSTDELKTWFKTWWNGVDGSLAYRVMMSGEWEDAVEDRPELDRELRILLGVEKRGENPLVVL